MPQCETVGYDGGQCRGYAYGEAVQCRACVAASRAPATELTLTVIAASYADAAVQLNEKRRVWETHYPHCRLLLSGETVDAQYTKSRKERMGERQHWQRFLVKRK